MMRPWEQGTKMFCKICGGICAVVVVLAVIVGVVVSGFDTSKVTNTEDMFSGCNKLIGLDVSNFTSDKIYWM